MFESNGVKNIYLGKICFRVIEDMIRIGNYENALKIVNLIRDEGCGDRGEYTRDLGYQQLAKAIVLAGEHEKGFYIARNILNKALFISVFIAGLSRK